MIYILFATTSAIKEATEVLRVTEPYTIFQRTLPSGKKVYYYQFRLENGKRSPAYSTGQTKLSQAKRVCKRLYDSGKFLENSSLKFRKLARAEIALELSGDLDKTVRHIASDSWPKFNKWYSSYKIKVVEQDYKRDDIDVDGFKIRGIEAVTISERLPAEDRKKMRGYIERIFEILKRGDEPAIIDVYDKKEAARLERLRDKARGER